MESTVCNIAVWLWSRNGRRWLRLILHVAGTGEFVKSYNFSREKKEDIDVKGEIILKIIKIFYNDHTPPTKTEYTLTPSSSVVTLCTTRFTIHKLHEFYIRQHGTLNVFCTYLRANSNYFPIQQQLNDL